MPRTAVAGVGWLRTATTPRATSSASCNRIPRPPEGALVACRTASTASPGRRRALLRIINVAFACSAHTCGYTGGHVQAATVFPPRPWRRGFQLAVLSGRRGLFLLPLSAVRATGAADEEISEGEALSEREKARAEILAQMTERPGGQGWEAGTVGGTWLSSINNDPKTFNTMSARDGDTAAVVGVLFDYLADYDPYVREFKPTCQLRGGGGRGGRHAHRDLHPARRPLLDHSRRPGHQGEG